MRVLRPSFDRTLEVKKQATKTQNGTTTANGLMKAFPPFVPFCGLQNNPNLPTRAQNLFLKRISKLKLLVRALSRRVEACSYCARNESRSETRYSSARIWFGSEVTLVEYVTVTSLLMRRPRVNRADGVEPLVPPITGLISKRVRPKRLLVARCAGALISASVNKLVAAPTSDCERIDELVSPEESCPVVISDHTSACGNAGSERTEACGCESGPVRLTITRYPLICDSPWMLRIGSASRRAGRSTSARVMS